MEIKKAKRPSIGQRAIASAQEALEMFRQTEPNQTSSEPEIAPLALRAPPKELAPPSST
jgi:hypothetical protein